MVGLNPTATRVEQNTQREINERIRERASDSIRSHRAAGPREIDRRLDTLDREWDFERAVEVEAPLAILAGLGLGAMDRRWLALPAFAASMLLVHSLQGWYPWLPVFRRAGLRTRAEIDAERRALLRLRAERARHGAPVSRPSGDRI